MALSGKSLEDIIKELKKLEEDLANLRHEITQRIMNGERLNSKEENK